MEREHNDNVEACEKHEGETIKFFCRRHNAVGCGDCIILNHQDCNREYIKTLSENYQQDKEYQTLKKQFENLASEIKENEDNIRRNQQLSKYNLTKALDDIRHFRRNINKYLDRVEADIVTEAKAIVASNDEILSKLEQDCARLSTEVESINHMLNSECYRNNELFINTVKYKPKVSEIGKEVADIESTCLRKFQFVPNEELKNLSTSDKHLGQFVVTAITLNPKRSKLMGAAGEVTVGSQVRRKRQQNATFLQYKEILGLDREDRYGTVTEVLSNGTVTVKWYNGNLDGPYRIGIDMILI